MSRSPFLEEVRSALRVRHYSYRTEQAYLHWIRRFILFHGKRHPREMGISEVRAFLSHLARDRDVAAATQNQALNALNFLYRHILERPLGDLAGTIRAKKPQRLPVVLTRQQVAAVLGELNGDHWLVGSLLYGAGLRLMECLRLRVHDVDFETLQIIVRSGKGAKDRVTILPESLVDALRAQVEKVRLLHERDMVAGFRSVALPHALERKYPSAGLQLGWRFLFPAPGIGCDPRTGIRRRHHVHHTNVQKAVKSAIRRAGIRSAATGTAASTRTGHTESPDSPVSPRTTAPRPARRRGGCRSSGACRT